MYLNKPLINEPLNEFFIILFNLFFSNGLWKKIVTATQMFEAIGRLQFENNAHKFWKNLINI